MNIKIKYLVKNLIFLALRVIACFKSAHYDSGHINIIGDVRSESGLGAITRQIIASLDGQPNCQIIDFPMSIKSRQNGVVTGHHHYVQKPKSGINIFIGNPDMLIRALFKFGPLPFLRGYCIGLWFWELERPPCGWVLANKVMNEIWVQSSFVRDAFAESNKNVLVMPFSIEGVVSSKASKEILGLPENKFIFLFTFDFLSHGARKNPGAVIDAFKKAFGHQDDVALVLKSVNADKSSPQFLDIIKKIGFQENIYLLDGYVDAQDLYRMIELSDCYVSFHRSEGLGLGMAEAMKLGTLVIATGYSGNLSFMNESNSLLVRYDMSPIQIGEYPYRGKNNWADIDIDDASEKMRLAFLDKSLRETLSAQASIDMDKYSTENQRLWINARLREIS